ncbi:MULTISPECIES: hypothetical protein [Sphingomonas]|uniref:hypothetical protein n=1 Tax=Sphingomonas TaxID=13687 RepID=UPI00126A26E5|nr:MULTISPECIES: hypothetical protein [Sphingomonas]
MITAAAWSRTLQARGNALLAVLERHAPRLALAWLAIAGAGSALRLSGHYGDPFAWLPYAVFTLVPALALTAGLALFGGRIAPPVLARHPLYGAGGLMLSLLLALLAAILLRGLSFLTAIPAAGADSSPWLGALHSWLTADATLACSLYAIAFAAGLRRSGHFPALLASAWAIDLAMQVIMTGAARGMMLPPEVAAAFTLLLHGNLTRVLVSLAIWMPYLLLSRRVAITYRHEYPARLTRVVS